MIRQEVVQRDTKCIQLGSLAKKKHFASRVLSQIYATQFVCQGLFLHHSQEGEGLKPPLTISASVKVTTNCSFGSSRPTDQVDTKPHGMDSQSTPGILPNQRKCVMRKAALSIVFMLLATTVARAEIPWQENLRAAHAQATAEGKLLLLHFYGDNCIWCDRLEAGAFQSPQVSEAITSQYVPVKIHVGKDPSLAQTFQVKSLPTDVVVTTAGKALSHRVSPQKPGEYVNMLASAARLKPAIPSQTASGEMVAQTQQPAPVQNLPVQNQVTQAPIATNTPAQTTAAQLQMPGSPTVAATQASPQQSPTTSGFSLPTGRVGGVTGQLVGARTDGMSLGMPGQVAEVATEPETQPQTMGSNAQTPDLAMEGYCAVSVMDDNRWVEGNPKHGVIHLGRLYLFSSAEKMQTFLADPVPYTPVMNGIDVIRFFEERKIVQGQRDYGVKDQVYGRMFFFADAAARDHFENQYERYTDAAIEVMKQAVSDANPSN